MEPKNITQEYLSSTFTNWMRGGCYYLNAANDITRSLFEQQRVHTPLFENTYTYEQRYIIKQLTRELYNRRN